MLNISSLAQPWLFSSIAGMLFALSSAQAACPSNPGRFLSNGAEVTDTRSGLTWARCSEGQTWSGGACTGAATSHNHEGALQLAQAATGWRLPNVKELASLVDRGCETPAVDKIAFPGIRPTVYWSSSPYVFSSDVAWTVEFNVGDTYHDGRRSTHPVLLVRAGQ